MSEPVFNPITKKQKQEWIEALRSGKYKQGRSQLKRTEGSCEQFCCLGVLGDINDVLVPCYGVRESLPVGKVSDNAGVLSTRTKSFDYQPLFLPNEVQEKLYQLNDRDKWPFDKIATYIDENVETVD